MAGLTELFGSVGELGFIAAIAAFLVYFLTIRLAKTLEDIIKQIVILQLLSNELLQVFHHHDAQIRGVNPTAGKDDTEAQEIATLAYNACEERLKGIELQIQRTLDNISRK